MPEPRDPHAVTERAEIEREVVACLDDLPSVGHAELDIRVTRRKDGSVTVTHGTTKPARVLRFGNRARNT